MDKDDAESPWVDQGDRLAMVGSRSCGFRLSQGADATLVARRDGQMVRLGSELSKDIARGDRTRSGQVGSKTCQRWGVSDTESLDRIERPPVGCATAACIASIR